MITALLLPLLALGTPTTAVRATGGDDPPIQVWISNDRRFLPGDRAKVQVRTREDGYLLVLHADPNGHLRVLFPLDPGDDNFVRGGRKYEIRGRGGRESFTVDNDRGRGTVYAAVSHDPFKFDQFVLGDHWDYRNLAPQRLSSDPEQDLNELVRRMVDNSFDYDILTYDVLERVVYASDYNSGYYSDYYGAYDGCSYSYFCGRPYYGSPYSLSIGLFFGRPYYRRYYYDPFYASYNPFYDPFFYDPYYYRPYYYPGYYPSYAYPYGGYYYNHYYSGNRFYGGYYGNRNLGGLYTPYRFRLADASAGNYRDRRFQFGRAVNTVYMPPVVRDRQPANANPLRRVTDARPVGDARPAVGGRTETPSGDARSARRGGDRSTDRTPVRAPEASGGRRTENRMSQPNIDARRARQPDEVRSIIPDSRDRTDRRNLPTEIRPNRSDDRPRRAVDRAPQANGGDQRSAPEIDARRSRPDNSGSPGRGASDGYSRPDSRPDPQPDTRRSDQQSGEASGVYRPEPRAEPRSEPQARAEPRLVERGSDRGGDRGGDRGSDSPPARSAPPASDGGGMRGGSGGGGSGGGGGGSGGGGSGGGGFRRR
jgi:hypothetical protein